MRILVAVNDEFMAKNITKRFSAENDKLYYISGLNLELRKGIKVFPSDSSIERIQDIFKTYSPELVIFCNNVKADCKNDLSEIQVSEHVKHFFNLYTLADKYKTNRFIYVSSEKVYGENLAKADEEDSLGIESRFAEAHYICEQHIQNSQNHVSQKSLILRISTLYDNDPNDHKSIVDQLILDDECQKQLPKENNLQQAYDFLHTDDFISVLVEAKDFKENDIVNIGSGKRISVSELDKLISAFLRDKCIDFNSVNVIDGININKAINDYKFSPRKHFDKSLKEAIRIKRKNYAERSENPNLKFKSFFINIFKSKPFKASLDYVENLALFGILLVITNFFQYSNLNSFIDLRIAYIALIGLVFGIKQSSLAAILCIGFVLINYEMDDYGLVTAIYDNNILITVLVFISVAMITGYIKDRHTRRNEELEEESKRLKEQLEYTRSMYNESIAVKDLLQFQVFNVTDSYGRIFSSVEKLNSLHFDKLKTEIIVVAEEVMHNNSIALFMVGRNKRFLRLLSCSNKLTNNIPKSVDIENADEFNKVYHSRKMYLNLSVSKEEAPLMIAPIINENNVIAMLVMYEAPFEMLTLSYKNLFSITSRLISQAIVRAYAYKKAQEDKWYIGESQVLTAESFSQRLVNVQQANKQEQGSYVVLWVDKQSHESLMKDSYKYIREFDYVGMGKYGEMYILLNNISEDDLPNVVHRLKENGIDTTVVKEEYAI